MIRKPLALDSTTNAAELPAGDLISASDVSINAATEINAALADGDEIAVYDLSTTSHKKSLLSRIWTYISGKVTSTANTFTANQIISVADNTNAALRITQTGTGDCLLVEDSANTDSSPFVIANNGKVFVGNTTTTTIRTVNPNFQFNNFANNADIGIATYSWGNHNNKTDLMFIKSRSTSSAVKSIVLSADFIGGFSFSADNGVDFVKAAEIAGGIDDSTPSLTSMPGRLIFSTTPVGATSPSERVRIVSSGDVGIGTTTISARTHIVSTTEQLRLGYDATKFASFTVNSVGSLAVNPVTGVAINANTTDAALRITQTGTGNALLVEDSANPDSSPFVVNNVGTVGIGTAVPGNYNSGADGGLVLYSGSAFQPQIRIVNEANDNTAPYWNTQKSRAGATVQLNDGLGTFTFRGADTNNAFVNAAFLSASVDGAPGLGYIPTRFTFYVTDTAGSYIQALNIISSGYVGVNTTAPSAQLHIIKTTEQLRIGYDATKYISATVDSSGNTLLDGVGTIKLGEAANHTLIGTDGTLTLVGTATAWDDLLVEMRQSLQGVSAKPDWDATNFGLLFPRNDTAEYVVVNVQLPHRWKEGSTLFPHVHFLQSSNATPTFAIDYRWTNIGEAASASWTTFTMSTIVGTQTWTTGLLHRIVHNTSGISGTGKTFSSMLQIKLYRNDNTYVGDCIALSFDLHFEVDSFGTSSEYAK